MTGLAIKSCRDVQGFENYTRYQKMIRLNRENFRHNQVPDT